MKLFVSIHSTRPSVMILVLIGYAMPLINIENFVVLRRLGRSQEDFASKVHVHVTYVHLAVPLGGATNAFSFTAIVRQFWLIVASRVLLCYYVLFNVPFIVKRNAHGRHPFLKAVVLPQASSTKRY